MFSSLKEVEKAVKKSVKRGGHFLAITKEGMNMLINEIEKNSKEKIRVSLEEYKGHKFIDCRVYWQDDAGEWRPSKKGIALNDETISDVIQALQKAGKELKDNERQKQ